MNRLHAIVINYHREALTRDAVASLLASRDVDLRVVMIDNEGDGAWARAIWREEPRVRVLANARNLGFGAACNQGIEHALADGADAVLLFNNDARIEPDAARLLCAAALECGLAAPKILLPDGRIYAAGGLVEPARGRCRNRGIYQPDGPAFDRPCRMPFASACALAISRRALETGARFFEPYFLYYEDADLCLRLARAGFAAAYVPQARVTHLESASTGGGRAHHLEYYDTRNRLLWLARNVRGAQRLAGTACVLAATFQRLARHALAGRRAHVRARWRGLIDGLAGRYGPYSPDLH
jgi:GT2 family glycosyltransferase